MSHQRLYRLIDELISLYQRDLDRVKKEVEAFPTDDALWQPRAGIANSAGNLAMHICGNLRHFIGHVIGATGYERQRELEFSVKDLPRSEVIAEIERTKSDVATALKGMDERVLQLPYPVDLFGTPITHAFFLMHLSGHLQYHLGQMNYYRRLN